MNLLCLYARTLGHTFAAAADKDSGDLNDSRKAAPKDSPNRDNTMKTHAYMVPWLLFLSWLVVPVDAATDRELMVALTASWNCMDPSWRRPMRSLHLRLDVGAAPPRRVGSS